MSQGTILKILEKLGENEWITTRDLSKILKITTGTVTSNIIKLRKQNAVESQRTKNMNYNREFEHRLTWEGRQ